MDLFVVVIAIAFIQVWGGDNPLHKDQWFSRWGAWGAKRFSIASPAFFLLVSIVPVIAVGLVIYGISWFSSWLILPISTLVLLYSFGRGEFSGIVTEYTRACADSDWTTGVARASRLGVKTSDLAENDWAMLHSHVLDEAGYRGFERMFVVLFWFFLVGPLGAFAYRCMFLFSRQYLDENPLAKKVLWVAEWPAVRLLGLTFALTGNFVGCYRHWKNCVFCAHRTTVEVLSPMILGALSVDDDLAQTCDVTRRELELLDRLYTRTLWFWLAAASLFILFG